VIRWVSVNDLSVGRSVPEVLRVLDGLQTDELCRATGRRVSPPFRWPEVVATEAVRQTLPEAAKDIRLNLQSVLEGGVLSAAQKWGVAAACAIAARNPVLRSAVVEDAREAGGGGGRGGRRAAAAVLMGMNTTIYYRFRHMVGKPGYSQMPPRLSHAGASPSRPPTSSISSLLCLAVSGHQRLRSHA